MIITTLAVLGSVSAGLSSSCIARAIELGYEKRLEKKKIQKAFDRAGKNLVKLYGEAFAEFLEYLLKSQNSTAAHLLRDALFEDPSGAREKHSSALFKNICRHNLELVTRDRDSLPPGTPEIRKDFLDRMSSLKPLDPEKISEDIIKEYGKALRKIFFNKETRLLCNFLTKEIRKGFDETNRLCTAILGRLDGFELVTPRFFTNFKRSQNEFYYQGGEPDWWNILQEMDYRRGITDDLIVGLLEADGAPTLFCPVLGEQKSGKSTFLMRAAFELAINHGRTVLFSKGTVNEPHAEQVIETARESGERIFAFVENITPTGIEEVFLDRLRNAQANVTIVATVLVTSNKFDKQPGELKQVRDKNNNHFFLKYEDIGRLEEKLDEKKIALKKNFNQALDISQNEPTGRLCALVFLLTEGKILRESIEEKFNYLDQRYKKTAARIAVFYEHNIPSTDSAVKEWLGEDGRNIYEFNQSIQNQGIVFTNEEQKYYWILNTHAASWCVEWYAKAKRMDFKAETINSCPIDESSAEVIGIYLLKYLDKDKDECGKLVDKIMDKIENIRESIKSEETLSLIFGYLLQEMNKIPEVEKFYQKAIEINPEYYKAHNNYALLLAKYPERREDAEDHYKKALDMNLESAFAHNNYANLLKKYPERRGEAELHYIKALEINPESADAHNNYAILLAEYPERLGEAEYHYKKALDINPESSEAHNNYANLLARYPERLGEAEEHYMKALDINPEYSDAHNNYAILLAKYSERLVEAEDNFKRAIEINPEDSEAHNNYAVLLAQHPERLGEAELHYIKGLEMNPEDALAHNNYAILLAEYPERLGEAELHYIKALEINFEDSEAHNNYANLLTEYPERLGEAEYHYKKALDINPEYAEAHNNYALLLARYPERRKESELYYIKALEINPGYGLAHYNYALLLSKYPERLGEAEYHYKKALDINPELAEAHNNYALLLSDNPERRVEAEVHYKKALDINPEYADAHNNYANLLKKYPERRGEAEEHYMKALDINPESAEAHNNYANLLAQYPERFGEAEDHYRKALEINPESAEAHANYGILLNEMQRYEEAIFHLEKALKLGIPHDAEKRIISLIEEIGKKLNKS